MRAPAWSLVSGEDRYGFWAVLQVKEIKQRLRWIPPGRFLMGSPVGEPERSDDELQHEVELTQGFWLAETTCTQALWQEVMGENPSEYKDAVRPVETISHDDCLGFLERVNRGGSWYSRATGCRSAARLARPPHYREDN